MKRTLLSLLVVGLFTGVGTSAMAQNVTAGDQTNAGESSGSQTHAYPETGTGMEKPETAGAAEQSVPNPDKNAAGDKALLEYQIAKEQCDNLKGSAISSCITDAKATRDEALKQATTQSNDKGAANESDTATPVQQQAEQQSNDMGAANESDTATPDQQQAKKASTDEDASTTTN